MKALFRFMCVFTLFMWPYSIPAAELVKEVTDRNTNAISSVLRTAYGGAQLILPIVARSKLGTLRVGAVHTGINARNPNNSNTIFHHTSSERTCTPTTDLLDANRSLDRLQIQYDFNASGGINLEVKNVFSLLSLEASHIDSFALKVRDSSVVSAADNIIRGNTVGVRELFDDPSDNYCKRAVFCGPKRTFVINSIVEGKIDIEFIFKQTATGKMVDFVIDSIGAKVGLNLNVNRGITADGKEMAVFSSGENVVGFAATRSYWRHILDDKSCS